MSEATDNLRRQALEARRENRIADARRHLLDAVDLLRPVDDPVELAQALRELGEVERRLQNGDAARGHYEEAVAILRESDESLKLAHAIRHLGDVFYETERVAQAEPCFHEALAIYRSHEETPPLELANAIRSLAVLKSAGGETGEAGRLWAEAHDLYLSVGVHAGVAESKARLAILSKRKD